MSQIISKIDRRHFLQSAAVGSAILTAPHFLTHYGQALANIGANPFLTWFGIDEAMLKRVMAELTFAGTTYADIYFQHSHSTSIALEGGIINKASVNVSQGVGLRNVLGDQVGYAFTEDLSETAMKKAAKTAASIANQKRKSAPININYRPETKGYYSTAIPWTGVEVDKKLAILRKAEQFAKASDPSITKVQVYWGDTEERILLMNETGNIVTDIRPTFYLSISITAEKNGVVQSNSAALALRDDINFITDDQIRDVVKKSVDKTLILFEAKRPPAGELPVILAAGASGILLHEAIGHGLEADFNRIKTSIYSDMMGKKIAADFVTIIDDATISNQRGALNVDDEGMETEKTVLVENGVLKSYMHDRISAAHYGLKPTGSGRRESYKHAPMPRMRCTTMLNGPHTKEEIIASIKGTAIIAETFTNGQVSIGAGDFTFYIKNGWLVENGKITTPIKDTNIIGNGPEVLKRISMAANDSKLDTSTWTCGKNGQSALVSQGLPTVLVSKMTVGGQNA